MTDWFQVESGLKQGCLISPLLFSLYLNDFCDNAHNINVGVPVGEELISVLLYADDTCLIAKSETDLQRMLNVLHDWCAKWMLQVNSQKTPLPFLFGETGWKQPELNILLFAMGNTFDAHCYIWEG